MAILGVVFLPVLRDIDSVILPGPGNAHEIVCGKSFPVIAQANEFTHLARVFGTTRQIHPEKYPRQDGDYVDDDADYCLLFIRNSSFIYITS